MNSNRLRAQRLRVERFWVIGSEVRGKRVRIERFEDTEEWQLARELTRKINERKVARNAEP